MNIQRLKRLAAVASTDDSRYVIQHILFRNGLAVATDGRRMAIHLEGHEQNEKLLHRDFADHVVEPGEAWGPNDFDEAVSYGTPGSDAMVSGDDLIISHVDDDGNYHAELKPSQDGENGVDFPDAAQVVPDITDYHEATIVGLDARLLHGLVEALDGGDGAILLIKEGMPILVMGTSSDNPGILMPLKEDGEAKS